MAVTVHSAFENNLVSRLKKIFQKNDGNHQTKILIRKYSANEDLVFIDPDSSSLDVLSTVIQPCDKNVTSVPKLKSKILHLFGRDSRKRLMKETLEENGTREIPTFEGSHLLEVPEGILLNIFGKLEDIDCMHMRFVCKRLQMLVEEDNWFWRHLAISNLEPFSISEEDDWRTKFAERNLIRNPSGENGLKGWKMATRKFAIMKNNRIHPAYRWEVEKSSSPEGPSHCFVAPHCPCAKFQIVNLIERGFNPQFLDLHQPPIAVSDYFSAKWNASSLYCLTVMLLDSDYHMIANFTSGDTVCMSAEGQNVPYPFQSIEHTFRNYGKGLRFIHFEHMGMENMNLWRGNSGHIGATMKNASVRVLTTEAQVHGLNTVSALVNCWEPKDDVLG